MIFEDLKPYINKHVSFIQKNNINNNVGVVKRGLLIIEKHAGEDIVMCCFNSSSNPGAVQGVYSKLFPKDCDKSWSMGSTTKCYRNLHSADILGEI